ncbi:hypothetical protein D3C81_458780 [compost metagenome]
MANLVRNPLQNLCSEDRLDNKTIASGTIPLGASRLEYALVDLFVLDTSAHVVRQVQDEHPLRQTRSSDDRQTKLIYHAMFEVAIFTTPSHVLLIKPANPKCVFTLQHPHVAVRHAHGVDLPLLNMRMGFKHIDGKYVSIKIDTCPLTIVKLTEEVQRK